MADAEVAANNIIDSSVAGIQVIDGLYGIGGVIIIGLIIWAIVYTYRVWPQKVMVKKEDEVLIKKINEVSSQLEVAVKSIDALCARISKLETAVKDFDLSEINKSISDLDKKVTSIEVKETSCKINVDGSLGQLHTLVNQFASNMGAFRESVETSIGKLDTRLWELRK